MSTAVLRPAASRARAGGPGAEQSLAWWAIASRTRQWALRLIALGMAAVHTVVAIRRQSMNEDGINYLDVGAAFMSGEWATAINAIWSPLYAWTLGAVIAVARPSVHWEFPVVHLTNFAIFAATLACFELFWRQLTQRYYDGDAPSAPDVRWPPAVWDLVGYSLFLWSSLNLIEIWAVTPDMMVAAVVYLAAGLLLRASGPRDATASLVLLGLVLGVGYLAKAALFPLGLACIALAGIRSRGSTGIVRRMALAAAPFALVAAPLVVVLSMTAGRLTFGDVGRFTYLKHVNELRYPHWGESVTRVDGRAEHPPRRVFEDPDVYEFARPVGGSYPLSFDPGYWTEGLSPRFDLRQQLRAVSSNARFYFDLFVRELGGFTAVVLLLAAVALRRGARARRISAEVALVAWASCAFFMYLPVFVTGRYIAPFVVLFWAGILACLTFPDTRPYTRIPIAGGLVLALALWVDIGARHLEAAAALSGYSVGLPADPSPVALSEQFSDGPAGNPADIADGLLRIGVTRGSQIGVIGESFTAFWARLAGLRIVAEIAPEQAVTFWDAGSRTQAAVLHAFAEAGAEPSAVATVTNEWRPIGETGYLVRFLR